MKKIKKMLLIFGCLILLSSCSLPGLSSNQDSKVVSIATSVTTESQILAEIVSGMVEHYTDKKTSLIRNLGTAQISHRALLNGDADIAAARYTGTDVTTILKMEAITDPEKAVRVTEQEFKKRYGQIRFSSYGFDNTFVFLVKKETAEKYNLEKVSDLENISEELTVGTDRPWLTREGDGYPGFIEEYGFEFKKMLPMQIGLVYDAVAAGKVDVVLGYSTDGRIMSNHLVALEDDRNFFPPYDAVMIANQSFLQRDPQMQQVLSKLEGVITTETMQSLNFEADNNLLEPAIVAQRFLQENNYFEDK